jgi:hypothetical protein
MGKRKSKKDVKRVLRHLKQKRYRVKPTRAAHVCVFTPGGPVFCSSTPSDMRGIKNFLAMLKRKGVKI